MLKVLTAKKPKISFVSDVCVQKSVRQRHDGIGF